MGKPVFWREFWLLWSAGAITTATFAALVEIPTTPLAGFLLLRGHSEKALLVGAEAMEITIGLAIAVSCGLLAAHRIGLGAPIVERWLSGEPIKSQVRALLVPCLVVGISTAVISMLSNLPVFHPNRQLARQEAQRISESPSAARVGEKLGTFTGKRLTLASLTVSYLSGAIEGELIARLFLLSGIALILAKITRTPSGAVGDGILFSAVFAVAAISTIDYLAWQAAASQMIFTSVGITTVVHDPLWVVIARALLRTVPGAVGFGWLYVRRGIESAILGAFIASVVAHVLLVIAVVHLV